MSLRIAPTHFKKFIFSVPTRSAITAHLVERYLSCLRRSRHDAPIFARVAIFRFAGDIDNIDVTLQGVRLLDQKKLIYQP